MVDTTETNEPTIFSPSLTIEHINYCKICCKKIVLVSLLPFIISIFYFYKIVITNKIKGCIIYILKGYKKLVMTLKNVKTIPDLIR